MTIVVAASPSSASHTLVRRLEKSYNTRFISLKTGNGSGNLSTSFNLRAGLLYSYQKIFFKETIIYQHLFPTEYNLKYLDRYFNLEKVKFIITYRNIFEIINNLQKWKDERKHTPLSFRSNFFEPYDNFESDKFGINIIDPILIINFYAIWFKIFDKKLLRNILLVNYDEIVNQNKEILEKLENFLNKKIIFDTKISDNIWPKKEYAIKQELKDFIINYCESFKDINFEKIGIKKNV